VKINARETLKAMCGEGVFLWGEINLHNGNQKKHKGEYQVQQKRRSLSPSSSYRTTKAKFKGGKTQLPKDTIYYKGIRRDRQKREGQVGKAVWWRKRKKKAIVEQQPFKSELLKKGTVPRLPGDAERQEFALVSRQQQRIIRKESGATEGNAASPLQKEV